MDVKQFRQIIREEVVKAMQEELREILTEAVEIASRPEQPHRHIQQQPGKDKQQSELKEQSVRGLSSLLQDTASSMSSEDYRDIIGTDSMVPKPDFDVLKENSGDSASSDVLPDFVARAAEILAAANEKDRKRHGV